jgi:hypothetical protein
VICLLAAAGLAYLTAMVMTSVMNQIAGLRAS